jgi:glycosyltransferase involved in cell wall biosynthesis
VIIGDGPERDRLLWCRDQWKLSDCVHFLGHRNDVASLIPNFDVLLSPSAYEGQSNAILEAMAAGVPVIATDIPGNRDLVIDGETGLLVPDGGDDFRLRRRSFVEKTLYLLEHVELRRRMGKAAKQRIAEFFSLDQMVRRYTELYRELSDERKIVF